MGFAVHEDQGIARGKHTLKEIIYKEQKMNKTLEKHIYELRIISIFLKTY